MEPEVNLHNVIGRRRRK